MQTQLEALNQKAWKVVDTVSTDTSPLAQHCQALLKRRQSLTAKKARRRLKAMVQARKRST